MRKFILFFWIWRHIRSLLFQVDAETVHHWVCSVLKFIQSLYRYTHLHQVTLYSRKPALSEPINYFGMNFKSRIGLAAGFDKNGEVIGALPLFGFGFAEIGTVTPRPQIGNIQPRLFRLSHDHSLLNQMGFNNQGANSVAVNLERARPILPHGFRIGVNIGKNKNTPIELAHKDYRDCTRILKNYADYLVINVSSPNTPLLKTLQTPSYLHALIDSVLDEVHHNLHPQRPPPPVLLKLSPDLSDLEMRQILKAGQSWGLSGWILANTLPGSLIWRGKLKEGGLSGGILTQVSRRALEFARPLTSLPIISVGGIMDEEEAQLRIKMGADLIQIYTGWIYKGPFFPWQLSHSFNSHLFKLNL